MTTKKQKPSYKDLESQLKTYKSAYEQLKNHAKTQDKHARHFVLKMNVTKAENELIKFEKENKL